MMKALVLTLALLSTGCPALEPMGGVPFSRLEIAAPPVSSLRATATIERFDHGKRLAGRALVFMKSPSSIRFEILSPLDTPLAVLAADASSFSLLDSSTGTFYTGPPDACNVARLLGIPLPPTAVAAILAGTPPLLETKLRRIEWNLKGYHLLTLESGDMRQTVQIVTGALGTSALRSIVWKDDAVTQAAVKALADILANSEYILTARLRPGMGLICNNVLHTRSGFSDSPGHRRLLYRGRYYDRLRFDLASQTRPA